MGGVLGDSNPMRVIVKPMSQPTKARGRSLVILILGLLYRVAMVGWGDIFGLGDAGDAANCDRVWGFAKCSSGAGVFDAEFGGASGASTMPSAVLEGSGGGTGTLSVCRADDWGAAAVGEVGAGRESGSAIASADGGDRCFVGDGSDSLGASGAAECGDSGEDFAGGGFASVAAGLHGGVCDC